MSMEKIVKEILGLLIMIIVGLVGGNIIHKQTNLFYTPLTVWMAFKVLCIIVCLAVPAAFILRLIGLGDSKEGADG